MDHKDVFEIEGTAKSLVEAILAKHDIHRPVSMSESLTDAGISSLEMVNLMLSLEAKFDIFIPPALVNAANFRSIAAISDMVRTVRGAPSPT